MLGLDFGVSSVERSGLTLSGASLPRLQRRGLAPPNGSRTVNWMKLGSKSLWSLQPSLPSPSLGRGLLRDGSTSSPCSILSLSKDQPNGKGEGDKLSMRARSPAPHGVQGKVKQSPPSSDCGAYSEQSKESPGLLRLRLASATASRNDLLGLIETITSCCY